MLARFKCGHYNIPGNRYSKYSYRRGKRYGPYFCCRECEIDRMARRRKTLPPHSERVKQEVAIYMEDRCDKQSRLVYQVSA